MKIIHVCLAAFYIDDYGYQENILPKMHKLQDHDVKIVASTETYLDNKKIGYIEASTYMNENDISVSRIPYVKWLPHVIAKKLRIYNGLAKILKDEKPDIIFLHDVQFLSIVNVVSYVKSNPHVKMFADGHTDFINSAKNWISKNILHKIIYRWCAKKAEPYIQKFWGVTPLRSDFFHEVYKISKDKIGLLVLGVDDSDIKFSTRNEIRTNIRKALNIDEDEFVLISGGKLDRRKKIHELMTIVDDLENVNITLIVFGVPVPEIENEINSLSHSKNIKYIGWLSPDKINDYYFASDLAVFPGTHSVLWEQAVGVGLPAIFKKWQGMEHVDIGGNCLFLRNDDPEEIKSSILKLYHDVEEFNSMKQVAIDKGITEFSYSNIARKAIGE